AAVVVEHPGRGTDDAAAGHPPQPAVDEVQVGEQGTGAYGGRRETVAAEPVARGPVAGGPVAVRKHQCRLDQRGDRQAGPGGDDLVVPARLGPRRPGGAQPGGDVASPGDDRLAGRVEVAHQAQYRGAVLEGAPVGDAEQVGGEGT